MMLVELRACCCFFSCCCASSLRLTTCTVSEHALQSTKLLRRASENVACSLPSRLPRQCRLTRSSKVLCRGGVADLASL